MEQPDLKSLERRPLKHWNVDGLPELLMGLIWLTAGAAYTIGAARGVLWLPFVAVLLSAKWWMRRLKERITYPRAGYVQPLTGPHRVAWVAIKAALVGALIVLLKPTPLSQGGRSSMIVGLILSVGFAFLAHRQGAPYLLWYAAVPPVFYLCYYGAGGGIVPISWMFLSLGAACTVGGAIRFACFLRNNPKHGEMGA